MEAQNPLNNPESPAPGSSLPDPMSIYDQKPSKKNNGLILKVGLGVGVVLLLLVALIVVSLNSSKAKKTDLDAQYKKGLAQGKTDQTVISQNELLAQAYVYKSPAEFGGFELPIPKLWSWSINPKPTDGTILGIAEPNYIDQSSKLYAFKLELKRADYDKIVKDYDDRSKKVGSDIKGSDITVSGIKGRKYVGTFDSKIKLKSEIVVIPLREKIMIFETSDTTKYGTIFGGILAGTKLVP